MLSVLRHQLVKVASNLLGWFSPKAFSIAEKQLLSQVKSPGQLEVSPQK